MSDARRLNESDVVSQLEAVIQGIEARIPHTDKCCESVTDGFISCDSCYCDRPARVRSEIARTVERMVEAIADMSLAYYYDAPAWKAKVWAAAFRATQEQETQT